MWAAMWSGTVAGVLPAPGRHEASRLVAVWLYSCVQLVLWIRP